MSVTRIDDFNLSPPIAIGQDEHRQLTVLALAGIEHSPDVADDLLHELDRAELLPDANVPRDIVRMGSRVSYRSGNEERAVTLVYPANADIAQSRISVLTPVGAALIGMRAGQSITSMTRDGRKQVLTVLAVGAPVDDGDGAGPDGPHAA
jgi:regulator of nucleoside diphosphate kinase